MAPVTVDATARNSYYSAGNIGWQATSAFAYRTHLQQLAGTTGQSFGNNAISEAVAQSFTPASAIDVTSIRVALNKSGTPTDNVSLKIYSDTGANLPNASLGTADNVYNGANVSTTQSWVEFHFATPVSLSASTKYWMVLERSTAVDGSNNYLVRYNSGSVYASNGVSVRNSGTWGAESSTNDMVFQILTETPSALYQLAQDTGGSPKLHMWKSTDDGANWSEVDSGNAPAVNVGTAPFDGCDTRTGPYIGVAYFTGATNVRGRAFDMSTDTWGTEWNSGDATNVASQERSIRVYIDNTFTTATHGTQHVSFCNSADDADLFTARRTTSTWAVATLLSLTNGEASLVSAVVTDKSPIGFAHRFYYDCTNDDFDMRSLTTTTQGTQTALDAAAADVETEHASACYQIYQASGVDKIVAAYIDADGSIEERTATLEVTSASVTLGTQHAVGTATTSAGRQLATCSFDGDLYVVASVSGTDIDYYVDAGATGTWSSATNWKTGLTASSISNVLSIEGYGLLVTYTDNGDVKVDWISAPAGDVTVNGSLATASAAANASTVKLVLSGSLSTATAAALAGTTFISYHADGSLATASAEALAASLIAIDLTGSVAAADGAAYAGTLHTGFHVNGALATADGAALTGNLVIDIPGNLATGTGTALTGSLDILIQGGNATATGQANASTVAVDLSGSLATADASAFSGSLAIDIAGLTATADAVANDGVAFSGYTVLGSLATASAQANDGTTGIDDGTSNGDDKYRLFQLRTLPTSAEE
jgi:hypothetical protein